MVCLGGTAGLRGRGGGRGGVSWCLGGDGSIRRLIRLQSPSGALLVTCFGDSGFGGWWFGLGGGGGGHSSLTVSSPSQSPPTIPAHIPSSSAPVYPICLNPAHFQPCTSLHPPTPPSRPSPAPNPADPSKWPTPRADRRQRCDGGARVAPHGPHGCHARTRARAARPWRSRQHPSPAKRRKGQHQIFMTTFF